MKKYFVLAAFTLVVAACSSDIHAQIVTTDNETSLEHDVQNATGLSDAEKKEFAEALARSTYQPYGKTVSQVVSDQKRFDEQQDAAEALAAVRQAQLRQELEKDITIYPDSIPVVKGQIGSSPYATDDPYRDLDTFVFLIQNNVKKAIKDLDASVTLTNRGGVTLFTGTLEDTDGIAAGGSAKVSMTISATEMMNIPNALWSCPRYAGHVASNELAWMNSLGESIFKPR